MHLYKLAIVAFASLALCPAAAVSKSTKDVIKVNRTISYFKDSVGTTSIRQCDWNARFIDELVDEADGRVQVTSENLSNTVGRTLTIVITSVQANDKTRPGFQNWAHVRGELKEGDRLIATFTAKTKPAISGPLATCKVLSKFAEELAEEVADWTKKPKDAELGYRGG